MLNIENIHLRFGGIIALNDVTMSVDKREIVSLIGPNGSGKTSVLNVISGFYRPQQGRVHFERNNITDLPPHKRAEIGISRTFQNLALYVEETVFENLMSGRIIESKAGLLGCMLHLRSVKMDNIQAYTKAEEIIRLLGLEDVQHMKAGSLPVGIGKRVELGRALMLDPKIILVDEIMAGLTDIEKEEIVDLFRELRSENDITILLVDHEIDQVLKVSDRIVVLQEGKVISEGLPDKVIEDKRVVEAYLGG